MNPAPGVTQGLKPYTLQGSNPNTWDLAPQGTPLWHTTWFNFAPRAGAAYILREAPNWETVLRAGGGVFFDTGQQLGSTGFYGPGFIAFGGFVPESFPVLPPIPALVNPPLRPYDSLSRLVQVFSPHLQLPYTIQRNLSIEQALGDSQALTVSYVGSHGSRLLEDAFANTPGNPNSSVFTVVRNGLTSDYNSLQLQFRRRLSQGLTALVSLHMVSLSRLRLAELQLRLPARQLRLRRSAQPLDCFLLRRAQYGTERPCEGRPARLGAG